MKKLEDIPKAQPFQVPDNYFEDLPMRIQARIQKPESRSVWAGEWGLALKLAIPILIIGIGAVLFWPRVPLSNDPLASLDSVPTSELLAYLEADEISTEEILENGSFTATSFSDVDPTSTIQDKDMNEIIQQYDFNF